MKGGKGEGGKKGEKKKTNNRVPQQGSKPRPFTLQPTAYGYRLEVDSHVRTIHVYIANFDFDDLTVAALAPPISINTDTYAC